MNLRLFSLSGALLAPLLFCVLFCLSACGLTPDANDAAVKWATGVSEKTANVSEKATSVRQAEITRAAQGQNATATASGQAMDTAFVHRAESGNIDENSTYLEDPLVNGKPGAILSVTQNWNPGGGSGTYNDHPVDVRYDTGRQQWAIYNTDDSAMPDGAAFNVAVSGVAPMTGSDAGDTNQAAKSTEESGSETTTEAVLPEDILDKKDLEKAPPEYEDWYKEGSDSGGTETSDTSAGAIPAVKPFNLGKDPGGPDDKTLYLTVPALGLNEVPIYNSVKDKKLKKSVVHIPATGFPWQEGANTYIAGHRLGYEGTGSYRIFYYLDQLGEGDEILLEDEAGDTYEYHVTEQKVIDPENVEVMEPEEGKTLVSLQTCTLPDYKQRLIVQGKLADKST